MCVDGQLEASAGEGRKKLTTNSGGRVGPKGNEALCYATDNSLTQPELIMSPNVFAANLVKGSKAPTRHDLAPSVVIYLLFPPTPSSVTSTMDRRFLA